MQELYSLNPNIKWAIAGRSKEKLNNLIDTSKTTHPEILIADVNNQSSLQQAIASTKVLINCVGPFRYSGEKVVKLCIENATNYVDINGETEFVERIHVGYHELAVKNKG